MGSVDALTALHARAVIEQNRGRPQRALRLLERCRHDAEALPDTPDVQALIVAIWISIALNRAELEGVDEGLQTIGFAASLAERLADPRLLVRAHSQRAFIAIRAGRYELALEAFSAAETLLTYADDNDQFAILLNAGTLRMFEGDLARARPALQGAADLARRVGLGLGEFKARHNLAYLEFLNGELPAALQLMDEANAVDTDVSRGVWLLDRSRVLVEAGLVRSAEVSLAAAAAIFRRDRLSQDLAETELERARCAVIGGEIESARRLAMRARDRFRRRGNDRWRRSAELVLLQADLAAGRPATRLIAPAGRLREEFLRDGNRLLAQTAALIAAEANIAAGQVGAARTALSELGRADRRDPITARLHTHYVRARLDEASGRSAAASTRARTGLDELAAYQASFGSIDLATAAAVHGRRLAELDLSIALTSTRPARVLAAAERARAVSSRLPAIRPPDDPQTAALLAELRQTVESLRAVEQDHAGSAPLQKRRRELEAQIAARSWSRAGGGVVRTVVGLDELYECLGATTMISFSRSNGVLHAVVLRGNALQLVELGSSVAADEQLRRVRADLDVLAQPRLPGPLRGAVSSSLARSLATLDAALLGPLAVSERLVVVSTGLLGQLPWGLLPSLRGVPVVVAPSASAWHAAHTQAPSRRRRVVAVAGPGLDRGVAEADGVGRIWGSRVLSGSAATSTGFATALAGARIVHVAAHGLHQTENPLFSSLRLADGPVFAHELDQTVRTADHVVLSACDLGLATVRPGDEALGLTSVLLHLGTRSVVAGVARVGDEVAATTMTAYHDRLAHGHDSAAALAGALADSDAAPFVCFGASFAATPARPSPT